MSTEFYLLCKEHKAGITVFDSNGNTPDHEEAMLFALRHGFCNLEYKTELKMEVDDYNAVMDFMKQVEGEIKE